MEQDKSGAIASRLCLDTCHKETVSIVIEKLNVFFVGN